MEAVTVAKADDGHYEKIKMVFEEIEGLPIDSVLKLPPLGYCHGGTYFASGTESSSDSVQSSCPHSKPQTRKKRTFAKKDSSSVIVEFYGKRYDYDYDYDYDGDRKVSRITRPTSWISRRSDNDRMGKFAAAMVVEFANTIGISKLTDWIRACPWV